MAVKPKPDERREESAQQSGRGDPSRSMELLWGTRKAPSRGPKPSLSLDQIVRVAIGIADAEGLEALSMRRVAGELGFTTMSLYRHVPGKTELLDVMLDTVHAELPLLEGVAGGWRAKLEVAARGEWALYHRHPWALQVPGNRPAPGPHVLAGYESAMRAVADIGLTENEMMYSVHLISAYVQGAARASVDAARAEKQTGISDRQWWSDQGRFWDAFDFSNHPTLKRVIMDAGAYPDPEVCFEFGLERVLDGIEALVARAGQRSSAHEEGAGGRRAPAKAKRR